MVGEERAYLGRVITCGFQTRYGFCFFQLHGGYEKAEPVPGSFHASILSPRRLTSFANVGLSRAQLVPSCPPISCPLPCHMVIMMKGYGEDYHIIWYKSPPWFQSLYHAIWLKWPCDLMQIAPQFDADCKAIRCKTQHISVWFYIAFWLEFYNDLIANEL